MRLMAAAYGNLHPGSKPNCVRQARFLRVIEIAAEERELEFCVEAEQGEDGEVLVLSMRVALKGMRRMLRCAELVLNEELSKEEGRQRSSLLDQPGNIEQTLTAELIYQELVPFGPAFQSLSGAVWLADSEAGGLVRAPVVAEENENVQGWLGSPFPLDGAMHLACVHGQRRADFVPFPVALKRRRLYRATQASQCYQARVRLRQQEADMLVYDLWLAGSNGDLCEEVQGLVMRDISGGRMRPPAWWRHGCGFVQGN